MFKRNYCKYHDQCKHFREASYTCTHEGGSYCGKFREFENQSKLTMEVSINV